MNFIIIEDEPTAAKRLKNIIQEIRPNYKCMDILETIQGSVERLYNQNDLDLVFQDINLADGNSFEIFNHVKLEIPIIFTTAYDEYAIDAFKVNTIDYLLKPIKKSELEKAIDKLENQVDKSKLDYKKLAHAMQQSNQPTRFLIRIGQKLQVVEISEVAYFYTFNKINFLISKSGHRYPIDYTMEKLEQILDHNIFFRINRQFIVSLNSIEQMIAFSKSRVKLTLKPASELETIVSTDKSPLFKKWLAGSLAND